MNKPILYIFMRNDLDSLTPGKAMAQAAHVGSKLAYYYADTEVYSVWVEEDRECRFGTTVVLQDFKLEDFTKIVELRFIGRLDEESVIRGVIIDPSYPIRDGYNTHYIQLDTCAYILTNNETLKKYIKENCTLHS